MIFLILHFIPSLLVEKMYLIKMQTSPNNLLYYEHRLSKDKNINVLRLYLHIQ